jgi:hypothetical protein
MGRSRMKRVAIDEVDLLGFGLLPGLALTNSAGTLLAVFHVL